MSINHVEERPDADRVCDALEIDSELPLDVGVLHLDCHPSAVLQHTTVHLPDARRTKGLFVNRLEFLELHRMPGGGPR